jgi:hypothetical protein
MYAIEVNIKCESDSYDSTLAELGIYNESNEPIEFRTGYVLRNKITALYPLLDGCTLIMLDGGDELCVMEDVSQIIKLLS